jgi:hypothetical protein
MVREKGKGRYTVAGRRSAGMMMVLKKEGKEGNEKRSCLYIRERVGD